MARMLIDNHGRAIPETCLTADQVAWMDSHPSSAPKTPLEAAIDKATGFKPGEEAEKHGVASDAAQGADETKQAEVKENAAPVKENAAPVKEKRDWVKKAYECFIRNAVDLEPTDPAGAVWEYFKKNATDELKAKVEQEGKTGASCWKFIEQVARKALGGRSGHIDPVAVYAIAMHYFQDVPKDWDRVKKPARREAASVRTGKGKKTVKGKTKKVEELERKIAQPVSAKHAQELKAKLKQEKERIKEKEKKSKAKKRGGEQGFFFDLMETETVGPDAAHGSAADQDGKEAGDAE